MSNTYRLTDVGFSTYKKIMSGRKAIGRVSVRDGRYFGIIGTKTFWADTEDAAFRGVVALHCGCSSASEMAQRNAVVRAVNRQNRAKAQYVADELIRGNFEPLNRLFKKGAI